jgi:hypothetical protein
MPTLVWHYLTALLYDRTSASGVALAEALQTMSHDRLTRLLQADWSGQRLLELACRTLFVWKQGYFIIEDTVLAKPFATAIEGLAWVYSSQTHKPVYRFPLVLLVWTNGTVRLPRACDSGTKAVPRRTRWRWNGSVMPAIVCAVARSMRSLTHGIARKRSSNAFGAMDGILCVACRRIAAATATRCVSIGDTPIGPRLAG